MIDSNKRALLELIKSSLFGADAHFPEDTDWKAVYNEASAQAVAALALPAVPNGAPEKWQTLAAQSTAHYMRVLFEQTALVKLFASEGIMLVILKGTAAAMYYPKPQLRTMGDVDFMTAPGRFDDAAALMEKNGYAPDEKHDNYRHCGFSKGGVIFELHRHYSDAEKDVEPVLINGMQNAVTRTLNGCDFPTLPDCENGLVLLDHIRHHLHDGVGLRQIADWAAFAGSVLTDAYYNEIFLPVAEVAGLTVFCKVVTKMCKMYLGLPDSVTWCDGADADTASELMDAVMKSGNFGNKDPYEHKPAKNVARGVRKRGLFRVLQDAGVANFAICRKSGFFRCFAWLLQGFRYAVRGIAALLRGERLIKDIKDENEKQDLIKKLGLLPRDKRFH